MKTEQIDQLLSTATQLIEVAIKHAPPNLHDDLNNAANLLCEACGDLPDEEKPTANLPDDEPDRFQMMRIARGMLATVEADPVFKSPSPAEKEAIKKSLTKVTNALLALIFFAPETEE